MRHDVPMRLRHELTYPAGVDDVVAMLLETAFWDRVAVATGALSSTTTVTSDESGTLVVTDQLQEVVGVPSFAKKLVGDSTQAIKRQLWTGATSTFEVETPGKPTRITGSAAVTTRGTGSVLSYDLEVRASVPLIGGKLERLVADLTIEGFDNERAAGLAWLKGGH